MKDCHDFKVLLVGLIDGELTPEETQEVNSHLIRCAACRQEYERLLETGRKLQFASFKEPGDETLELIWKAPYSRFARNAALLLVLGGFSLLIGYAVFELLTSGKEGLPVKVGIAAVLLGLLILLAQLARERIKTCKSDPYKEIER
jgi:anti-sigma factor RsiW